MRILVTGSAGHLGEALVQTLQASQHEVAGLDILDSPYTTHVGSICDPDFVRRSMRSVDAVIHTATLHKPHLVTHSRQAFIDTNISGTLTILEAALATGASGVVFTSSTSAFGAALIPPEGQPATWVTEDVEPIPKNMYGATKTAAEELCRLFHKTSGLPSIVLRTSRFFLEADDDSDRRRQYDDLNLKANEFLYRRLDLADAVDAHVTAAERLPAIGFGRYIVSATTPFSPEHLSRLRSDAAGVVRDLFPDYEHEYSRRGWTMLPGIERVYVNQRARQELGWSPRFDFGHVLDRLARDEDIFSPLARKVGTKPYQPQSFVEDGPYPVEKTG